MRSVVCEATSVIIIKLQLKYYSWWLTLVWSGESTQSTTKVLMHIAEVNAS